MASILDFERFPRKQGGGQNPKASSRAGGLIGEVQDEEHSFVDRYLRLADKLLKPAAEKEKPEEMPRPRIAQKRKAA